MGQASTDIVIMLGNVGKRDAVLKRLNDGAKVANFDLCTTEYYQDKQTREWKEKVEWHRMVCWGFMADKAIKHATAGAHLYIEGKHSTNRQVFKCKCGEEHVRYNTQIVVTTLRNDTPKRRNQQQEYSDDDRI